MTATQALHSFMSSFGITAYPSNKVPNDAVLPYLTYQKGFDREGYSSTVHLYYHTKSELVPDNKAIAICKSIGDGGVQIPCEGGQLWITLESPKWYAVDDEQDEELKHRIINISISDFTI